MRNKIDREIYDYMKSKALDLESEVSDQLKSYRNDQVKYSLRDFTTTDFEDLLSAIQLAGIIYLGDFHTFDQASRNFERILRTISQSDRPIVLGVEFILASEQLYIDAFLSNDITEREFIESISYTENWRFPWSYYKRFFDMAKNNNFKIIALNSIGSLQERDQFAAKVIKESWLKSKNLHMVLFGELHIVPNKLPNYVQASVGGELKQVIIHQNLDEVYWRLEDHDDVIIKFANNEYSLQTSPPWIKYESMIYWYENILEDPEFGTHEYILESGLKTFTSSSQDNFIHLLELICNKLGITINNDDKEDFNLYDYTKLNIIKDSINSLSEENLKHFYSNLVRRGKSFRLPYSNQYYCSNYSINRIAGLCGAHLFYILLKKRNVGEQKLFSTNTGSFVYYFYNFFFTYLAAKTVNPYKKCNLYLDYVESLEKKHYNDLYKENVELLLKVLEDRTHFDSLDQYQIDTQYYLAKYLAYFIADVLFDDKEKLKTVIEQMTSTDNIDLQATKKIAEIVLPSPTYKTMKKRFF